MNAVFPVALGDRSWLWYKDREGSDERLMADGQSPWTSMCNV
jgi:hypothetical protein